MFISYDYYRVFYYVAKCRNFTQAASLLMSNQPNVTRTIQNLESQLGCTLFVRSNRGVRLTPAGERLYSHIRIAVEQIHAGEEELSMEKNLQNGTISIAASEVALRCFLLPVLQSFHSRWPGVRLRISNHSTPQALSALENNQADIALVTTLTPSVSSRRSLTVKRVKKIQETAVCGPAFSDLAREAVSLQTIAGYPLISLGIQTMTYEFYSEWFLKHGLLFSPDIEAATADQILPMVKNNLGIGFVPEEFLAGEDEASVIPLQLTEPIPLRSVCFAKRTDQLLSIAARELERMILENVPDSL